MSDSLITSDDLIKLRTSVMDFQAKCQLVVSECRAQVSETSNEIQRLSREMRTTVQMASVPIDANQ